MARSVYALSLFFQFSAAFKNLRYQSSHGGELRVNADGDTYYLDCSTTPDSGSHIGTLHTIEYDGCIFHWCSILYGWDCPVCVKGDWASAEGTPEQRAARSQRRKAALLRAGM